jgi:uncharacterized protein (TIGR03437 family)
VACLNGRAGLEDRAGLARSKARRCGVFLTALEFDHDRFRRRPALRTATTTPTVLIGGKAATVVFAGLSPQFVGVNQINVAVPTGTPTGDAVSLQLSLGGVTTIATVMIAVSQ